MEEATERAIHNNPQPWQSADGPFCAVQQTYKHGATRNTAAGVDYQQEYVVELSWRRALIALRCLMGKWAAGRVRSRLTAYHDHF
jgi:hypothetical protein